MTAPVSPGTDKALLESLRGEVYLDDVGANLEKQKADDAAAAETEKRKKEAEERAKIEAEARAAIPSDPRVKALEEALRISEEARKRVAALSVEPPPKVEAPEPELTEEQAKELWEKNPMAAIEKMLVKRDKLLEANFTGRISTLTAGNSATARELAEKKYADEFRLFGPEINAFIEKLPQAEQRLSSSKAWDDLIAYMRGQPGNFEKLLVDREAKNKARAAEEAHAAERVAAGAHTVAQIRTPTPEGGQGLDDIEREIARTMNPGLKPEQAYAEYLKWKKVAA